MRRHGFAYHGRRLRRLTINLVKDGLYDNFIATAKEKFNAKYGHEPKVYEVVISDGSRRLE